MPIGTHLHVHSGFSLLDGIIPIKKLPKRVLELGMDSVAITDHGVLHGAIQFYKQCKLDGVKGIIGIEAYVTDDLDNSPKDERHRDNYHLTLLAMNLQGYKNLIKMSSHAAKHNFYYKPRFSKKLLQEHNEGLIALSGCLGGEISSKIDWESIKVDTKFIPEKHAIKSLGSLEWLSNLFGDRFYLEVQDEENGPEQVVLNTFLKDCSKNMKLPIVFTADAHYLKPEDKQLHEVILCVQLKKTLQEYNTGTEMRFSPTAYLRSSEDMFAATKTYGLDEAWHNTSLVSTRCEVYNPGIGDAKIPRFDFKTAKDYKEFSKWDQK